MISLLKRIAKAILNPGSYVRKKGKRLKSIYWHLMKFRHPFRNRRRRILLSSISNYSGIGQIDNDMGYLIASNQETKELTFNAIEEAEKIIDNSDLRETKKSYLTQIDQNEKLQKSSEIYKLVTNPAIVKTVGNYLGGVPVLVYVSIWFSPDTHHTKPTGSQLYHLDHEDLRQVKLFVYVNDVDNESGPLSLLDSSSSSIIHKKLGYTTETESSKRVADGVFKNYQKITAVGEKGTLFFVDTSRCFHYGSRGGTKPRKLIAIQYLTPQAFVRKSYLRSPNPKVRLLSHLSDSADSPLESLLLNF